MPIPTSLRLASRRLLKSPLFTALAVAVLAIGIGLNASVFSLVSSLLLRPLPVDEPDRLAHVYTWEEAGPTPHSPMAFPDYEDLQAMESFEDVLAHSLGAIAFDDGSRQELVFAGLTTGNYFSLLGVEPALGRAFTEEEARRGSGARVAMLSHAAWRGRFGADPQNPLQLNLEDTERFLNLLLELGIPMVNLSAGSPYYNPHIQRPALYPPSDGYQPPEDPLVGVARQMAVVRQCKQRVPDLVYVGSGYTYLQEYLPHVAQAAVREGWVDSVGVGRMVLSYPELPHDTLTTGQMQVKRICRTFSDCTTAPRNGIISGCFPLDDFYKKTDEAKQLKLIKAGKA